MASSINDDRGFALVISCDLGNEGGLTYLFLDTCHEKHVEGSSTIPTHPLQNGNTMADHMYRNPDTFSVSGSFGMFGKYANDKNYDNINIESDPGRLAKIQSVFEYIKDNGILCTLTTIRTTSAGSSETRFKIRENMALERVSWIENQTSMQYSLSFKEIITVKIQEYEVKDDEDLPNIVMPAGRTLGQVLVTEELAGEPSPYVKIIILSLQKNGYLQNGIGQVFQYIGIVAAGINMAAAVIAAAILAIAGIIKIGVLIGTAVAAAVGASAAMTPAVPVGTIVGIAALAIIGVGITIAKMINWVKEKNRQNKMFKLVNGLEDYINRDGTVDEERLLAAINSGSKNCPSVNESEMNRLNRFLIEVKDKILAIQNDCMFYAISNGTGDNDPREVVLNIGNRAYYISFIQAPNSSYGWKMQVSTPNQSGDAVPLDGTNGIMLNSQWCPCTSFEEMDYMTTCIFKDATREYQVYLYAPTLSAEVNDTAAKVKVVGRYLCSYSIVVSKGNIQENVDKIYKAIDRAIRDGGYE